MVSLKKHGIFYLFFVCIDDATIHTHFPILSFSQILSLLGNQAFSFGVLSNDSRVFTEYSINELDREINMVFI